MYVLSYGHWRGELRAFLFASPWCETQIAPRLAVATFSARFEEENEAETCAAIHAKLSKTRFCDWRRLLMHRGSRGNAHLGDPLGLKS